LFVTLLPVSNCSLVVRSTSANEARWNGLIEALNKASDDGFTAHVEFVDDPTWYGATPELLRDSVSEHNIMASVLFMADEQTLADTDFPIVCVDLAYRSPEFRCIATELWGVENNLNISNMDWEDFADSTDERGIFRGFK
jgi:hypothetical protein